MVHVLPWSAEIVTYTLSVGNDEFRLHLLAISANGTGGGSTAGGGRNPQGVSSDSTVTDSLEMTGAAS